MGKKKHKEKKKVSEEIDKNRKDEAVEIKEKRVTVPVDEAEKVEKIEEKEEKEPKINTETFKVSKQNPDTFEKQVEQYNEKQSKNKQIRDKLIAVCVIVVIFLLLTTIFAIVNSKNENIIAGIEIDGIDVAGLSKKDAILKLEEIYAKKYENDVMLVFENYETAINIEIIQVEYLIEEAVELAYEYGRSNNIFVDNYEIIKALSVGEKYSVEVSFDEEIARQSILDAEINIPGVLVQSAYQIDEENEVLIISKGVPGYKIDVDRTIELLEEELKNVFTTEMFIEIPVVETNPNEIDVEKIHEEVFKEPQDAYIVEEPFAIFADAPGIDFDKKYALELLEKDKEEYEIPLVMSAAEKTIADLGEDAFPDVISTYTTRYDATQKDRTTNLQIAVNKVDGIILMPGEEFSYNQALGQRTIANGYKVASIYSAGEIVDGLGGGICQISSNLYNAALMADLEIVERKNHQFVPSYVTAGRDATVVYGVVDFKFTNTREYPIKIQASISSGVAKVSLLGIQEEEYKYSFSTNVVKVTSYSTQYQEDPTVDKGKETVIQQGVNGQVVEVYLTKTLNGVEIEKTLVSRDTYNPMVRIISRGTKEFIEEVEEEKEEDQSVDEQTNE